MFSLKWHFLYLFAVLCLFCCKTYAQQNHTIRIKGYVLEEKDGTAIPDVLLLFNDKQVRNQENGYYEYIGNSDIKFIEVYKLGYKSKKQNLVIGRDTTLNFYLEPSVQTMDEVYVKALGRRQIDKSSGFQTLSRTELAHTPGFLGQKDVLKAIRSLPGVGNGGEGNSGLYIRGGTAGQNLTLFNDAIIYNSSHMLGLFSVFNPATTEHVELYKSGVPANHTGRLSSLIDIKSSRNIEDSLQLEADIGPFSLNAATSIPLTKNWSLSLAARKTFMNQTVWPVINKLSNSSFFNRMEYDFYDLNLLSNIKLGSKDYIYLSAYRGGDDFSFDITRLGVSNFLNWKNTALSASWKRIINSRMVVNSTVTHSGYRFNFGMSQDQYSASIHSNISNYTYKSNLDIQLGRHQVKSGLYFANHQYTPNTPYTQSAGVEMDYGTPNIYYADESAMYIAGNFALTDKISAYAGVRLNYFRNKGPYTKINEDYSEQYYGRNKTITDYWFLEPSASLDFRVNSLSTLKIALRKNRQPLHLISVTAVNFPADFWMPPVGNMHPSTGYQGSIGYYRDFRDKKYHAFIDVFYKKMDGLTEFSGGLMNLIDNMRIEDNLNFGKGEAWGAEFFVKKNQGRLGGWAAYTLAFSNRIFPNINNGNKFPFKYDRRHDFSINGHYKLTKLWNISASFTFASGNAYTKPVSRYMIGGNIVNEYGPFNGSRMPSYHRLDIAAGRKLKAYKRFDTELSLSVYNIYNRQNPMYMFYMAEGDLSTYQVSVQPKSVALLPILPAVNYKIYLR